MNCRYDTRISCTEQCKHIDTCAWMKGKGRREKIKRERDKIGETDRRAEKEKAAGD